MWATSMWATLCNERHLTITAASPPPVLTRYLTYPAATALGQTDGKMDAMSDVYDDLPALERPDPFQPSDAGDAVSLDSEIDFDDEQEEDQLPLDQVEAREAGVLLDDPERLDEDADR
jgi:hypothetical protein